MSQKNYEIVAKSHDDVMTTGNHQNRIQWPRFSTWENFSCKNIHKLSIYEIFLKRHGDVIPTGNDQNRVQWTRLSIRFKFQQIWFKFWNNGGILKQFFNKNSTFFPEIGLHWRVICQKNRNWFSGNQSLSSCVSSTLSENKETALFKRPNVQTHYCIIGWESVVYFF